MPQMTDVYLVKDDERTYFRSFELPKDEVLATVFAALMLCPHCEEEHGRVLRVEMRPIERGIDAYLEHGGHFEIRERNAEAA